MRAFARAGIVAIGLSFVLVSCDKKSGEARVLAKEHIATAEVRPSPSAEAAASTPGSEQTAARPLAADEIVVDQIVMKAAVRGTSKDPRALPDEQWLVTVSLLGNGLQFNVHADKGQWEKIKIGDEVHVQYSQGKYTGTVWGAEIK
jgi:hypothetical protein